MEITKEVAGKVLEVVDAGLCAGKGQPTPGQMCVEAAVTFALGEDFSDKPSCVDPVLRSFKIKLNDLNWSNNTARAKGLRRIAIAQLGTAGTLNQKEFVKQVVEVLIRKTLSSTLRIAAEKVEEPHKTQLQQAADRCEQEGSRESALEAEKVADAAAAAAAANAANYAAAAANAANYAAAANAAYADYAAAAAANAAYADYAAAAAANAAYADYAAAANAAAAYAAANAAYASAAAAAAAYDKVLADFAEDVVQILIKMETPGSKFLCLTETPG